MPANNDVNFTEGTKTHGSDDGEPFIRERESKLDSTKINKCFVFSWALCIVISFL
jgi:hypothetical protein